MAKKTMKKQVYADRYRGRLTFGADASTGVFETFNTGMNVGRETAYKWTLLGATIGPANIEDIPNLVANSNFKAQLLIGTHTSLVEQDDMQCIADVSMQQDLTTEGAAITTYPLVFPILSPLPVFAQTITIGMVASNTAAYNSLEWAYCLWYVPAQTSDKEMVEYLAAYGQV